MAEKTVTDYKETETAGATHPSKIAQKIDDAVPKAPTEPPTGELFPIRLLRGYVPVKDMAWKIIGTDGLPADPPMVLGPDGNPVDPPQIALTGLNGKIEKGFKIMVPGKEAKRLIALGVAERADDIPD